MPNIIHEQKSITANKLTKSNKLQSEEKKLLVKRKQDLEIPEQKDDNSLFELPNIINKKCNIF